MSCEGTVPGKSWLMCLPHLVFICRTRHSGGRTSVHYFFLFLALVRHTGCVLKIEIPLARSVLKPASFGYRRDEIRPTP